MSIHYEAVSEDQVLCIRDLCNELMAYQKTLARIRPELFDSMCFETRMIPSLKRAKANLILIAKDEDQIVGYAYSNISPKETYSNEFATFFDLDSVKGNDVGCLSQFYIREKYRNRGIGTVLFERSMTWLQSFASINNRFIFVSNGNDQALRFYLGKGFAISHPILDGFITVLRNS
ncbi:acetyltransferase (GNAT) family protein [Hydrogenispora ethanolica]|uniref:Acetyltransferase (GNAT) family protein n=1 Tax=Hydrogenispora ethanolica TaxID=1082276 RepID=A0A4V2QBT6_HYDET|nr:GNAT family N-acetyltransferase [Hydrogenispora ethanolica]TCL57722.1 acetyltransferase (GNAT) family protein [Hydrogenispora ethanolica]